MRNLLVLLAIVALLGGAAFVLLPGDEGVSLSVDSGQIAQPTGSQGEAQVDELAQATAESQADTDGRIAASNGSSASQSRTLQVVDENGAPQKGVKVYFADFGDAKWNTHFADMVAAPESLPPATALYSKHFAVSGLGGFVALPDLPFTLAAARDAGQYGAVMVPPISGAGDSTEIQLVMRAFTEVQVRVIDAQGKPVSDVAVTFEAASSQRLAKEGRARGNPFGPWQQLDRGKPTGRDGMTRVMTSVPESRMQTMQMPIDQVECAVAIHHAAFGSAEKAVSWGSREPVEFRLPPSGEVQVTVVGFPDGTHPVLRRVGPQPAENIEGYQIASDMLVPIKLVRGTERRTYRFTHIPLGQEWRVDFRVCLNGEEETPHEWTGSVFEGGLISGPSVAGEVVSSEFRRRPSLAFLVEFQDPNGARLNVERFNQLSVERLPSTAPVEWKMERAGESQMRFEMPLGTSSEGYSLKQLVFQYSPPSQSSTSFSNSVDGSASIEVTFSGPDGVLQSGTFSQGEATRRPSAPLYALVDVPQGPHSGEIDLGVVQFQNMTQFFTVSVVDAADGSSIEGAKVTASTESGRKIRDTSGRGLSHFSPREFGLPFSAMTSLEGLDLPTVDISVEHRNYAATSLEARIESGIVEIELNSANSYIGLALMPHWLPSGRMILVESGKRLFDSSAEHSAQAFLRRDSSGESSFSIDAEAGRAWDAVIFLEGAYNLELTRIPRVDQMHIYGQSSRNKLARLKLEDYIDHLELSILLPSGAAWEPGAVEGQKLLVEQVDLRGRLRERESTWSEGQLHLAIGKGTSYTGTLTIGGYQPVSLESLAGGAHTIQLRVE